MPRQVTTICLMGSLGLENCDGPRLCSQARSLDRTGKVPTLAIADAEDHGRLLGGRESATISRARSKTTSPGANADSNKRCGVRLQDNVQMLIEMAITEALTGLHNRCYVETQPRTGPSWQPRAASR
jgi:two-component system, cell cycle response regulator